MLCCTWEIRAGGVCFFFQAEDGIRDLVRSRGLGDVYKRQQQRVQRQRGAGLRAVDQRQPFLGRQLQRRDARRLSLIHI